MANRILVSGMGGELGTRVTNLLEADASVDEIVGYDIDPPRRRTTRADFRLIDPRDERGVLSLFREFEPTALLHLAVYEPHARANPASAATRTSLGISHALAAADQCRRLGHVVIRSGTEVYGSGRKSHSKPDESAPLRPTSAFGRSLAQLEATVAAWSAKSEVRVATIRLAPVVGAHFPSPLGRCLRLPAVPVRPGSCRGFSVLHQEDAAAVLVAANTKRFDGVLNAVAAGSVSALGAARMGRRIPIPVVGPGWLPARWTSELMGAPLPDYVRELLTRGRLADGSAALAALDWAPRWTTAEVIAELYEWAEVQYLEVLEQK